MPNNDEFELTMTLQVAVRLRAIDGRIELIDVDVLNRTPNELMTATIEAANDRVH